MRSVAATASALGAQALLFLLLAGLSILVAVLSVWARMTMQRRWRAWLTRHLIDRWLANDRFRQLRFLQGEDRNPEYRIAEDVRVATDAPVSMAAGLLTALLNVVIFVGILWNVGGDLVVEILGHVLTVPKYLVITVVIYSALLTLAMAVIGRRMVHVIAGKNAAEAQFRSIASNLRERGAVALRRVMRASRAPPVERSVQHRDRTLAGTVRAVHAHDAGVARQHPGGAGHRLGPVCAEIPGRHDVAGRGGPGGGRLCDGADGAQLAGGQLSRPGGMPVVGEPRRRVARGAGRTRSRRPSSGGSFVSGRITDTQMIPYDTLQPMGGTSLTMTYKHGLRKKLYLITCTRIR